MEQSNMSSRIGFTHSPQRWNRGSSDGVGVWVWVGLGWVGLGWVGFGGGVYCTVDCVSCADRKCS